MPNLYVSNIVYDVPDTEAAIRVTKNGSDVLRLMPSGIFALMPNASIPSNALSATMRTGTVALRLLSARLKALGNTAAIGGLLSTNTSPTIGQRNGDTDPGIRISWASSNSAAIVLEGVLPDNLDASVAGSLKLLLSYAGASDTTALAAAVFAGVGGSDLGGSTSALTASVVEYSIPLTLTAGMAGQQIVAVLTPGAHTTDILRLDGARIVCAVK